MSEDVHPDERPEHSTTEREVRTLFRTLLDSWNRRDAAAMASLFAEDGVSIGFDGSQMRGQTEISAILSRIFADHPTPEYVSIVRSVRGLGPDAALLTSVAGMTPRGATDIDPALNAIQSLVAVRVDGRLRVALFQNTPAAFHGNAEKSVQLTAELRSALRSRSTP
jgi:uncharacterized protein (TIGR02246 family)